MQWRIWKKPSHWTRQQQQRQMEQSAESKPLLAGDQQGDAALKANNPDRAERLFRRRVMSITPTVMQCWGWAMWDGAKRLSRRRTLLSADLAYGSGNTNAVRGLANIYRQQSPEKLKRLSPRSLPVSGVALMIRTQPAKRPSGTAGRGTGKPGKWAQAAALQRQRLALDPGSDGLLTDFRRISGRPDNAARPYVNAQSGAAEAERPGAGLRFGLYLSGHDQDRAALAHINSRRARSGTAIFRSWLIDCKAIGAGNR